MLFMHSDLKKSRLQNKMIEKMNNLLSINKYHSFEKPGFKH